MDHLALLDHGRDTARNGKTLRDRATGRFYTHEVIGRALASDVADRITPAMTGAGPLSVIDPFCGDGRLIVWLIEELAARDVRCSLRAALWDCEAAAVDEAVENVRSASSRSGIDLIAVEPKVGDSFRRGLHEEARFGAVVTNPPWELVKPDHRELSGLESDAQEDYTAALRSLDDFLVDNYPSSQPSRRFAGWGTNLSRVGTELTLRLAATNGGVCGVVSPSSLFADANSEALRRWIFSRARVEHLSFFPAEARLFDAVDVPGITFVAVRQGEGSARPHQLRVSRYDAARQISDSGVIALDPERLASDGWAIPASLGAEGWGLLDQVREHPSFGELEGRGQRDLWAGRELDETGRRHWTLNEGDYPLLKGRHVQRFRMVSEPEEFVDPAKKPIPASAGQTRLAWRDVSRPSQKRRVHATMISPGIVTGNSLGVAYFRDGDLPRLLALLGLMSSIPFEFQVRSRLSTGHVSLTVLRRAHVPDLAAHLVRSIAEATLECLKHPEPHQPRLEAVAAQAYGLDRDHWLAIASTFGTFTDPELKAVEDRWEG